MTNTTQKVDWDKPLMVEGFPDVEVFVPEQVDTGDGVKAVLIGRNRVDVDTSSGKFSYATGEKHRIVNLPSLPAHRDGVFLDEPDCLSEYYFIDHNGLPIPVRWNNNAGDPDRLVIGNCYISEDAAKWHVERKKLMHELAVFSHGHEGDYWFGDDPEYSGYMFVRYDYGLHILMPCMTQSRAVEALDKFGSRLNYLTEWTEQSVTPEEMK
jgi:hypothetical protein